MRSEPSELPLHCGFQETEKPLPQPGREGVGGETIVSVNAQTEKLQLTLPASLEQPLDGFRWARQHDLLTFFHNRSLDQVRVFDHQVQQLFFSKALASQA